MLVSHHGRCFPLLLFSVNNCSKFAQSQRKINETVTTQALSRFRLGAVLLVRCGSGTAASINIYCPYNTTICVLYWTRKSGVQNTISRWQLSRSRSVRKRPRNCPFLSSRTISLQRRWVITVLLFVFICNGCGVLQGQGQDDGHLLGRMFFIAIIALFNFIQLVLNTVLETARIPDSSLCLSLGKFTR